MKKAYLVEWMLIIGFGSAALTWALAGKAYVRRHRFGVPAIVEASRTDSQFVAILLPHVASGKGKYAISAAQLDEFLAGLKAAGCVSISLADVAGFYARGRRLPPKGVLITFTDEGPGLELADGVLKKLRLRGAAFISQVAESEDTDQRRFLTAHAAAQMRRGGAWEFGSRSPKSPSNGFEAGGLRFTASELGLNDRSDGPRGLHVLALKTDLSPQENVRIVLNAGRREFELFDGFNDEGLGADWIRASGIVSRGNGRLALLPTPRQSGAGVFLRGTEKWRDLTLEFDLKKSRQEFWAYARYKAGGSFVRVGTRDGFWYVEQKIGAKFLPRRLARAPMLDGALPAKVRIVLKGGSAIVHVNGRMQFGSALKLHPNVDEGRVLFGVYEGNARSALAVLTSVRAAPLRDEWVAPRGDEFNEQRLAELREEAVYARVFSPRWIAVGPEGGVSLTETQETLVRSLAGFYGCRLVPTADARALGTAVFPDPVSEQRLADGLLAAAQSLDARGLNVRLRGDVDRPATIAFLKKLRDALHARRRELWITIDAAGALDPALVHAVDGILRPSDRKKDADFLILEASSDASRSTVQGASQEARLGESVL